MMIRLSFFLFSTIVLTSSSLETSTLLTSSTSSEGGHLKEEFLVWKDTFQKVYKDLDEELERLSIWIDNHNIIESHNNKKPSSTFRLGHNHFSDLTNKEYRKRNRLGEFFPGVKTGPKKNLPPVDAEIKAVKRKLMSDIPEDVDWRTEGAVTPVKNQAMCGSCWAFSATGSIESANFLATGELVALSEQELVDCDHVDLGCRGGLMDNAFEFDEDHQGLCSEEEYAYTGIKGKCDVNDCEAVPGSLVLSFTDIEMTEQAHMEAIAQQPTSVAVEADNPMFQLYKSGVLASEECGSKVDHGVLAVGYGMDNIDGNSVDYWLIKNSWGPEWGDEGYLKIARETDDPSGTCGIYLISSTPSV